MVRLDDEGRIFKDEEENYFVIDQRGARARAENFIWLGTRNLWKQ